MSRQPQTISRLARDLWPLLEPRVDAKVTGVNTAILAASSGAAASVPVTDAQASAYLRADGARNLVGSMAAVDDGAIDFGGGAVVLDAEGVTIDSSASEADEFVAFRSDDDPEKRGFIRFYRPDSPLTETSDCLLLSVRPRSGAAASTTVLSIGNEAALTLTGPPALYRLGPSTAELNVPLTIGGLLTFAASTAASQVIPGTSSYAIRNHFNTVNNWILSDAGEATLRSTMKVQGGLNVGTPTTAPIGEVYCSGNFVRLLVGSAGARMNAQRTATSNAAMTAIHTNARGLVVVTYTTNTCLLTVTQSGGTYTVAVLAGPAMFVIGTPTGTQVGFSMSGSTLQAQLGPSLGSGGNVDSFLFSI